MNETEFLQRLGFADNPFEHTNADEEDYLQDYFIPPPYFHSVWGNPESPKSHVIFAPRGGGKSAQRRMIEFKAQDANVFAITYDRFEFLAGKDLNKLGADYHLRNIIQIALIGFLLEFRLRAISASAFTRAEREQVGALCQQYLSKISISEAIKALKSLKTVSEKAKQMLRDWAGPLNSFISVLLASQRLGSVNLTPSSGSDPRQTVEGATKAHLEIMRDLIRGIGFKSIYILVDKVDETPETGKNAEDSFQLVRSIICDLELLQMKGLAFKFFLWDKLEPIHSEFARPDRIQQFKLSWTSKDISKMLSRRLSAFSKGAVEDLSDLTDAALAEPLQKLVVVFAAGSPRDMIRVCQVILSQQLQIDANEKKIGLDAIFRGIAEFSRTRAEELLKPRMLKELTKVGRVSFTANFVGNDVFKISVNAARAKIDGWVQTGVVEKVGELGQGSRPIHQFAVTDVRVAVAMLPNHSLVDFITMKFQYCKKCEVLLLRDWDMEKLQTCHFCSAENLSEFLSSDAG